MTCSIELLHGFHRPANAEVHDCCISPSFNGDFYMVYDLSMAIARAFTDFSV